MEHADIIITNGSVRTMAPGAERPSATTVAIRGGKIAAVGGSEVLDLRGPATHLCDAEGATVLPGFVEAHMHLFGGAYGRRLLQLFGIRGQDALTGAVRAYAQANPAEGLLIAKGTDYTILGDRPVTRQALDAILPDRPLILIAPDHHTAWANTIALERAGILHGRNLDPGNRIVLDDKGLATGELQESQAIMPVMTLRTSGGRESLGLAGTEPGPDLTAAERAEDIATLKDGLRYCASHGITSIHNMDGNRYQLDLLRRIEVEGGLLCRTQIPFHLTPTKPLESIAEASELDREFRSEMLRSGRVKMFMDGVVDSGTAVLLEDYADTPGWRGEPLHSQQRFNAAATEIDRRGLQISVHAIGDGAVRMVLDGYQAARAANGARDSRHRIEHIEVLHPHDLPRFAQLGVVASMQPPHPPGSMGLPLVSTLNPGCEAAVDEGRNGFLVEAGDAEALAKKIGALVGQPMLRKRFAHESREIAVRRFDLTVVVGETAAHYERLLEAAGRPTASGTPETRRPPRSGSGFAHAGGIKDTGTTGPTKSG